MKTMKSIIVLKLGNIIYINWFIKVRMIGTVFIDSKFDKIIIEAQDF